MSADDSKRPGRPSDSADAAAPISSAVAKCKTCTVGISPKLLKFYVGDPDASERQLTATASPGGGTFSWSSTDDTKLKISGSGSKVTLKALDEGDFVVTVVYNHPACTVCSDSATVKVRYEVRNILVAQGIQFNNAQLEFESGIDRRGDEQIPTGFLSTKLSAAVPFPIDVSGGGAVFKNPKQGVKYIIEVTTDREQFKKGLETLGKPGTMELEYWHVIYDGHSRYGRGACFGTEDSPGENWENSSSPTSGSVGLYRMGYPFVGVPVLDVFHHGYTSDVVATHASVPSGDREYKGKLHGWNLAELKHHTAAYFHEMIRKKRFSEFSEADLEGFLADLNSLDTRLRIVGSRAKLGGFGATLHPHDKFWAYNSGEGPAVLLQAGWEQTVSDPMDLGATNLKCKTFCHLGCESFMHYRSILRKRKKWVKSGDDRFAYFCSDLSVSITGPFFLYYLLTYDQFNAAKSWEPSLEHARKKANARINTWCTNNSLLHPDDPIKPYEIW